MEAFVLEFPKLVLVAADASVAQDRQEQLRAMAIAFGFDPGRSVTRRMTEAEIAKHPNVQSEIDRRAKTEHGPAAAPHEREAALRALVFFAHGDIAFADTALRSLERAFGYLPRANARALVSAHRRAEEQISNTEASPA